MANQDSIVTDLPGTNGLLFPLRRFSSNYDGACVTRSGTSLTFAYCPTSPASNQLWYDKKAAPRTDPCEAWGNMASNSAGEPLRMDAKTYEYNTSINSGNAAGVSQGKARGAVTLTGLPGPLHRPIASKMLSNYIYSGGDVVLSQKDMGKVISAGKGSNVRDIPQRIRLDGLQSSSYASEGQVFASAPPSVTQYGSRTGKSRTGQPEWNGSDENLNFFAGWNRYVSADSVNGNPDYPSSAGDVWFGLGSFDLRTEGKVLSGYRCFNIYLYDRYMFANTGLSVGPIPPIVLYDEEMANLNRLGMAKSFNIRGVWRGCFLPPGPLSTMSCPGHPSLR